MKIFELDNNFINYSSTEFYSQFGDGLFHNAKNPNLEGFVEFRFRRKPLDTSNAFHNTVNRISKQKFGIPIRSCLFALPSKLGAENIKRSSTIYNVYPVSTDYKVFISKKTVDMTVDYDATSDTLSDVSRLGVEKDLYAAFKNDDYYTAAEKQRFMIYISSQIDFIMTEIDINVSSNDLEQLFNQTFEKIKPLVIKKGFESYLQVIEDSLVKSRVYFENEVLNYVESVEIVTSIDEIRDLKFVEVMVYDPKGFIFKKA